MKTTIEINGSPVEITLTKEQVEVIKKASIKITDRIKTYEDACEYVGISPLALDDYDFLPEIDAKHAYADHKLTVIVRALNEGWQPDYSNGNEPKYYPWMKWVGSGVGFSYLNFDCAYSASTVGARLSFKTRELAEYAAKQFQSEYNDYLTL